jgi:hypothetical protein
VIFGPRFGSPLSDQLIDKRPARIAPKHSAHAFRRRPAALDLGLRELGRVSHAWHGIARPGDVVPELNDWGGQDECALQEL